MEGKERIAVFGIGNVLMRDDAAGPYVIEILKACYEFGPEIKLLDLGTRGLSLTPDVAGLETVILIDTIRGNGTPGEIRRYEKPELLDGRLQSRVNPHDPAVAEALRLADLAGRSPGTVVLFGITPATCAKGVGLSDPVRRAVEAVSGDVIAELAGCGASFRLRREIRPPDIWWEAPRLRTSW